MVTKRFPIQLLFRIKHWWGQYVITMDIMRVGFPSLVQAYSRYTAIKLLLFLPLPLAIKQGINNVYVDGDSSVTKTYPVAFTKFQLPMCVSHIGDYSGWSYSTDNGTLTSVKIYATHYRMNLAVVVIGV